MHADAAVAVVPVRDDAARTRVRRLVDGRRLQLGVPLPEVLDKVREFQLGMKKLHFPHPLWVEVLSSGRLRRTRAGPRPSRARGSQENKSRYVLHGDRLTDRNFNAPELTDKEDSY